MRRLSFVNLHDTGPYVDEEVVVFVPGGGKVAIKVPLAALGDFVPILSAGCAELDEFRCPACGADVP